MVPCTLDEDVGLPAAAWDVSVKAGTPTTILDQEDEGHNWGVRGELEGAQAPEDCVRTRVMGSHPQILCRAGR